ncbi:MAG: MoxR family ATPase [Lentisphaeria bacterium]|nr:MoxR family ATPase [Lentisphaeria bacterium]NQZ66465.1 MoxR family ATPase [Lentisphaeria bacterium]
MSEEIDMAVVERAREGREKVLKELRKVIVGQEDLIDQVLIALFAGGHCLLIGVPGLAKTLLVSTLAKTLDMKFKRIQFTPDMMPSDITGTEILEEDVTTGHKKFTFVQGPVFTNLLLADEINRTPPKTQAALLEAMQEKQVSVGKETYKLEEPFMVMATQNPLEQEGTYPLPEAQMDRFMFNLWVDYPSASELKEIIKITTAGGLAEPEAVLSGAEVLEFRKAVRMVPISDHVIDYIVRLTMTTHPDNPDNPDICTKYLSWGAGPRCGQYLSLGAKARALLRGNMQATVEDVQAVSNAVMRHRIFTNFSAQAEGITSDKIIEDLLKLVPEEDTAKA